MDSRLWITRSFWSGAVLTFVGLLACVIALVLRAVGDQNGANGVWGVFLVAAVAWFVNFVALVGMLAWRVVREEQCAAEEQSARDDSAGESSSRGS